MTRWWVVVWGLVGCSPAPDGELGCLEDPPERLGAPCAADGECGNWLICEASECALPPAVRGHGGTAAQIVGDAAVTDITIEIARSDLARTRGLGSRPCIATGWGLVIAYPEAGEHLITTQAMRFDLDVAMAGDDRMFHTIHLDARAGSTALLGAEAPVRHVLEVPAGSVGLTVGDRLEYE